MKFLSALAISLVFLTFFFGCIRQPEYPDEPLITYMDLNQYSIAQGNRIDAADTLVIRFSFTDGDGDLGSATDSFDIFLTDSRDGFINNFKLPVIPEKGSGNGISGEVTIRIPNTPFNICCTFPDGSTACQPNARFPTDTFSYAIQIRDRNNRFSNTIRTETITVLCR
jgi:hypothetical protein